MIEMLVGIETGGTKVVAGVAGMVDGEPSLLAPRVTVPTGDDPPATFANLFRRLGETADLGRVAAVGIGSFGPVDLAAGRMGGTPKAGWSDFPLVDEVKRHLDAPVRIDTDVNAAGLAEWRWGAARGTGVAVYLTVGTGVGGGLIIDGNPVRGLFHPEMGHLVVPRHPSDRFEGACGAHGDCLEGLAAGPAIRERWGSPGESLPEDHPAWGLAAWYLGRGMAQITLAVSPEIIVVGGGVMARHLHEEAARSLQEAIGGYVPCPPVVAPRFGPIAGLMGAFALAAGAVAP